MDILGLFKRKAREYGITVIGSDIKGDLKQELLSNTWVVAGIEAIINALNRMGVEDKQGILSNGLLTPDEIIEIITYDYIISGNAYLLKDEVGKKISLFPLSPEEAYIKIDKNIIVEYKGEVYEYERIIHVRNIIPVEENSLDRVIVGNSIFKPIANLIKYDNSLMNMAVLNANANNLTILASFKDQFVGEETLKRLEAAIRRELENNKRINFLISPVAMDVKEIKTEMQNLVEIQKQNAIMILSVLRVPPIILGFGDSGNYVNRKEQLKSFYENAVFPIANAIEQAFRRHGIEIRFKRENVEVLQETLADKVNTLNALILAGYPLEQAAEMLGLPKPVRERQEREEKQKEYSIPVSVYQRGIDIKQKFYAKHVKLSEKVRQKILNLITTNRNIFLDSYYHDVLDAIKNNDLPLLDTLLDNFLSFINPKLEVSVKDLFLEIIEDYSDIAKIQLQGDILRYTMVDVVAIRHARKITRINDTVKNQIREVVIAGLQEGKPTIEIGEDIKKVFQAQRNRLNTIARTETTSILNDFVLEEAKMRDFTYKIWLTAHDEAVRHTHQAQDYSRVGIEEVFPNGLYYPGDVNGKPEEVINCRCSLIFE